MIALPAIRVQCITAAKLGSLLAWFVMSAPNCGGLMMILCAAYWLINISQRFCFSRDTSHSCRNTTLRKNLLHFPCCFVYIPTTAVPAPTLTRSFDVTPRVRNRDLRIAVMRIASGGRDVIKSITYETKQLLRRKLLWRMPTSPCQKKRERKCTYKRSVILISAARKELPASRKENWPTDCLYDLQMCLWYVSNSKRRHVFRYPLSSKSYRSDNLVPVCSSQ